MKNAYTIIRANEKYAEAARQILIRSITEICILDHNNDPTILNEWLANKTPENIKKWISDPNNYSNLALGRAGDTLGFSMISMKGEILLNYILPEYLFKGIGKMMLDEMETHLRKIGVNRIVVMSTITAAGFYKRNGYIESSECENEMGLLLIKYL